MSAQEIGLVGQCVARSLLRTKRSTVMKGGQTTNWLGCLLAFLLFFSTLHDGIARRQLCRRQFFARLRFHARPRSSPLASPLATGAALIAIKLDTFLKGRLASVDARSPSPGAPPGPFPSASTPAPYPLGGEV